MNMSCEQAYVWSYVIPLTTTTNDVMSDHWSSKLKNFNHRLHFSSQQAPLTYIFLFKNKEKEPN